MKVFLSYSHKDQEYANKLASRLKEANHDIWFDKWSLQAGDNLFRKINEGLEGAEALILIISKDALSSKWVMKEYSTFALGDISGRNLKIIPVLVDDSNVPGYLARYLYVDISDNLDNGINKILSSLREKKTEKETPSLDQNRSYSKAKKHLSNSLSRGDLTLVCGAGISIDAGVPSWNKLLMELLESMMDVISQNHSISFTGSEAQKFQDRYGSSSLIIGKYLKSQLGTDFLPQLRDKLYSTNPNSCDLIDSIIELARPKRDGNPLDSIITFNFDSLIEENLKKNHIQYKTIYGEGERAASDELPIYHVHGYLPRNGKINKENQIVFSEDAYHDQFIDSFSWSNLIQLNKLSQNTCLFVGLSLSDPNMRRLLDVANRKNPASTLRHYIIKKAPNSGSNTDTVDEVAYLLEEQDANELGLNVIWINDYSEIAPFIQNLKNK